jgi:hypothetical protein
MLVLVSLVEVNGRRPVEVNGRRPVITFVTALWDVKRGDFKKS